MVAKSKRILCININVPIDIMTKCDANADANFVDAKCEQSFKSWMPKTQFSPSFLVQCKRTLILSNSSQNRQYVSKQDKILSTEIWDNIGLWKVNQQYETSYPVDVQLVNLKKIVDSQ